MKAVMLGGGAAILAGGLYVHNPYQGGEVYALPVAEVYEKLSDIDIPGEVGGGQSIRAGSGTEIEREENKSITWKIKQDGSTMARFTADLAPVDAKHTRVVVHFQMDEDSKLAAASPQLAQNKFLVNIAEMAMTEQIDSTLDGRPYNQKAVGVKMLAYIAMHRDEMQAFIQQYQAAIDAAMRESRAGQSTEGGVAEAHVDEGGTGPSMSARPMVDPTQYGQ